LVVASGHYWLLAVGAACLLAAWFYTGGRRPYGYRGLGEVAVFVFFGPVAVLGTAYTQGAVPGASAVLGAVGVGMLSCAVLVANNLRDRAEDALVGKRTLAVRLGEVGTRRLYAALLIVPFLLSFGCAVVDRWALLALLAAPLAYSPARRVVSGVGGRDLVAVLADTAMVMLAWSLGTGVGLGLSLAG